MSKTPCVYALLNYMKNILTICSVTSVLISSGIAATVSVTGSNGAGTPFENSLNGSNGQPLPVGSLLQVGYFPGLAGPPSTQAQWDTFVNISAINWQIGLDSNGGSTSGAGNFVAAATLLDDTVDIPTGTLQYGVRIFDGTSVASSTNFNTVSLADWNTVGADVPTPGQGTLTLNVAENPFSPANFVWEDSANAFSTTIAVPEPSSVLLSALGLLALAGRRKRA